MDNRLLTPTFLSNNLSFVQKELAKEGMELVKRTSDVPGMGFTDLQRVNYEIVALGS